MSDNTSSNKNQGATIDKKWMFSLAVLSFFFIALYYPVLSELVEQWSEDQNYSHGFIVPFVSAYLVWSRKEELFKLKLNPSLWGLLLLFSGILIFVLGHVGAEYFLTRFSILIVISGLVLFLLGSDFIRLLAFPIGFLIFMIPLPAIIFNAFAFPLQLFAAKVSTTIISLMGIPVFRDGNIIQLTHSTLEVAEACSGIRSLITILTLATIYAYFMENKGWKKVVLVIGAIPIAIITNSFRVTLTAILAFYLGAETAEGFYHTFEGWFMFIVAFSILLVFGFFLKKVFK